MTDAQPTRGSCLCGTVQFEIRPPFGGFYYCHCERCRRSTGSAHAANLFMKREQFRWIAGEDCVTLFVHKDAGDYPRASCRTCGSPVPRFARDGVRFIVQAGLLESDPGIRPTDNIYWSMHAPWYADPDTLPRHDRLPEKKD